MSELKGTERISYLTASVRGKGLGVEEASMTHTRPPKWKQQAHTQTKIQG